MTATQTREKVGLRFSLKPARSCLMKKPVPDPPYAQHACNYYLINPELSAIEALSHTLELLSGIETTLDEYICANAGEPGVPMLVNTAHQLQMIQTLIRFVLQRIQPAGTDGTGIELPA